MFTCIKRMFKAPTALELATEELKEAQRTLLAHQTQAEYNRAMVQFDLQRIERLDAYINFSQTRIVDIELT